MDVLRFSAKTTLRVLILWVLVIPTTASAETLPIFGPKLFVRDTGQPGNFIEEFENCEPAAHHKLIVLNGDSTGAHRVSSASVSLNGAEIIRASDLNQHVSKIEKAITLSANNQLRVRLASQPGSFLTIRVECSSGCLTVASSSPALGAALNSMTVNVNGTVQSSAPSVGVRVNGVLAFTANGRFVAPAVPLTIGGNELVIAATNMCGNRAETHLPLTVVDPVPPRLVLKAEPARGLNKLQTTLTASVSSTASGHTYEWDFESDGIVDASGEGLNEAHFTYSVAGLHIASVQVTGPAGESLNGSVPVVVVSQTELQSLFERRLQDLKSALMDSDTQKALRLFHPALRSRLQPVFDSKGIEISSSLRSISIVASYGDVIEAIAELRAAGQVSLLTFYFALDEDGLWTIVEF